MEEFKKQEIKSVELGDWLHVGKRKVVVKSGSRFLRRKRGLLPNKPANKTGEMSLGQKDDSGLDCCICGAQKSIEFISVKLRKED